MAASPSELPRPDRLAAAAVWAVWLAATLSVIEYVRRFANVIPFWDDLYLVEVASGERPVTWSWLWRNYNDHRLAIPKLLLAISVRTFDGDVRAGMFLQAAVLSLAAAGAILVARRLRGRTSVSDAFLPLLWLHWGNAENWLLSFQLYLGLSSALLVAFVAVVAWRPRSSPGAAVAIAAIGSAMTLCGGCGAPLAPFVSFWLGLVAWWKLRASEAAERRQVLVHALAALAPLAMFVAYSWGFVAAGREPEPKPLGTLVPTVAGFLTLSLGSPAWRWWPWAFALLALLVAPSLVAIARTIRASRDECPLAYAFLACMGGVLLVGLAVGMGRGSEQGNTGLAARYVTMPSMLLAACYFAWCRFGRAPIAVAAQAAFLAAVLAATPGNVRTGLEWGRKHHALGEQIAADVRAGLSSAELGERHWKHLHPRREQVGWAFSILREKGWPPFDGPAAAAVVDRVGPFAALVSQPNRGRSPLKLLERDFERRRVLIAPPGTVLVFAPPPGASRVRGEFGLLRGQQANEGPGAEFLVQWKPPAGVARTLFDRRLDPRHVTGDRLPQPFDVELPREPGELVLRVAIGDEDRLGLDRTWWSGVMIE
jgi:hypothetical protein